MVVDVGSLNGTYVNREPVDTAVLANGDEVQIGKFRLVFLTGPRDARRIRRLTRGCRRPSGGARPRCRPCSVDSVGRRDGPSPGGAVAA